MPFDRVTFLSAGSCTQLGYLAGADRPGFASFAAAFVLLDHPRHGLSLIDTGYAPAFLDATRPLPHRLYRWLAPPTLQPYSSAVSSLKAQDVDPLRIQRVFLSHYHGDHIAGLHLFPQSQFIHRASALAALRALPTWKQVASAFLARLLPEDFDARAVDVPESAYHFGDGLLSNFRVHDFFDDGDLLIVDLPGHAHGHVGFLIRTAANPTRPLFYIADACWNVEPMLRGKTIPWLSARTQFSYPRYLETQEKLRRLVSSCDWPLFACHCPRTLAHVATNAH